MKIKYFIALMFSLLCLGMLSGCCSSGHCASDVCGYSCGTNADTSPSICDSSCPNRCDLTCANDNVNYRGCGDNCVVP